MSNIKPILSLNKHPNNCENLSLVGADNVQLSNDFATFISEKSLVHGDFENRIIDKIKTDGGVSDLTYIKVIGWIPCNTEFILFVINDEDKRDITTEGIPLYLIRYDEKKDEFVGKYDGLLYFGGTILGTFTYNGRGQLVIAYGESDAVVDVPLKTINLGTFEEMKNKSDNTDLSLDDSKVAVCPEIYIPTFDNIKIVGGNIKKGFYDFFVRCKINKNDYTKWFYVYTQFIGSLNKFNIIKTYQAESTTRATQGCTDHIDIKDFISTNTIQFNVQFPWVGDKQITYQELQICYICQTNDSTIGYKTSDLKITIDEESHTAYIDNITLSNDLFNEQITVEDLTDYYNYYNVKNIINYQNRLYISNYKEREDLTNDEILECVKNAEVKINCSYKRREDGKLVITDNTGNVQYETNDITTVTGVEAFSVPKGTPLKAQKFEYSDEFDLYCSIIGSETKHITRDTYGSAIFNPWDYKVYADSSTGIVDRTGTAQVRYNGKTFYRGDAKMYIAFVITTDTSGNTYIDEAKQPTVSYITCNFDLEDGNKGSLRINSIPGNDNLVHYNFRVTVNEQEFQTSAENVNIIINDDNTFSAKYNNKVIEQPDIYLNNSDVKINTLSISIADKRYYINSGETFAERQLETTLIPGEVYNFFVHFVDKYGEVSKGYRLSNTNEHYTNSRFEKVCIPISLYDFKTYNSDNEHCKRIALCPADQLIFSGDEVNFDNIYTINYSEIGNIKNVSSFSLLTNTQKEILKNKVINLINISNITWRDIQDAFSDICYYAYDRGKLLNTEAITYWIALRDINNIVNKIKYCIPYTNSNGDNLFRIPDFQTYISPEHKIENGLQSQPGFPYNTKGFNEQYETSVYDNIDSIGIYTPQVRLQVNVKIPKGYVGAFISYEKLEHRKIASGILSKNDCIISDIDEYDTHIPDKNKEKNNSMQFFCSDYDILDNIDLNYSFGCAKYMAIFGKPLANDKYYNNELYSYCFNQPIINQFGTAINFAISNPNLAAGGDITKNKFGIGTSFILDTYNNLYPTGDTIKNPYYFYFTEFYKINKQLYTSSNKTLIPISNIYYDFSNLGEVSIISSIEDGRVSYDSILSYNGNAVLLNTGNTKIVSSNITDEGTAMVNYFRIPETERTRYAGLFQFPIISNYPKEAKYFNNKPQSTGFIVTNATATSEGNIIMGFYVSPENSIDLFRNNYTNYSRVKTFINYNENFYYVYEYNNYVRRSNVIQDESLVNAWRQFPLEGYKIISENKGKITNLIGIGTVLLVHCEHSLFMFDRDNTLQTMDKAVQLQMPDIFDVDYKELITSDLGYAGLQDRKSAIVDQFGYIFYDTDKNRFYQYNNGKLDYIDNDIVNFLNNYKPTNIRFANDKLNNRLIISLIFNDNRYTLSYNYGVNKFISFHNYLFSDAFNTKNELYILDTDNFNVDRENTKILVFTKDEKYRTIEYSDGTIKNVKCNLNFIINDNYNIIKYLEYITYKLYEINNTDINYPLNTVGERVQPYSGETLQVYNDLVDTKELDIKVNSEDNKNIFGNYKKPYWDLGNWNFSYLRDKKQTNAILSRLYGNYFILNFTFGQDNQRKVEFEDINYMISKDKQI